MKKYKSFKVNVRQIPKQDYDFRMRKVIEILVKETISYEK